MGFAPDPRAHSMIELHHFVQATRSRHFSQKNFNFQSPSFSVTLVARLNVGVLESTLFGFLKDQRFLFF